MADTDVVDLYHRADIYEAIYRGRGKDYAAEAATVVRCIRDRNPEANLLLDVACGTGSHLTHFAGVFAEVGGIDLSEDMIRIAGDRVPGVSLRQGDMRTFDLGRTFDAITCMFSSVGYLTTVDELNATLRQFARHLEPGGVAVIEPWWSPDTFLPGYIQGDAVTVDGRTISRVSHSVLSDERTASRMEVHYIVAEPATGIQHFTDVHVMTLFSRAEYEEAFRRAGFSVTFQESGRPGPGLFIGTRSANR
ncbi:class I SAM-dependent methyltransferase [Streptomyces sp. GMR22]|uniref:class I SAM-dependent methyltransferase n=1 Tax=Streptomyces sp. GMR22 TaxID=2759524 RepID=UPI0015F86753|nr:class I SAM-dependent methyltransferase [Streptomyces sp. GMR22]MBA6437038.1 class I SAM-dependent methyltransferase [Streptomyces sp. GMR22]